MYTSRVHHSRDRTTISAETKDPLLHHGGSPAQTASEAENVKLMAPMFEATASAMAALRVGVVG